MKKISRLRGVKQKHGLKYMLDNLRTVPERKKTRFPTRSESGKIKMRNDIP